MLPPVEFDYNTGAGTVKAGFPDAGRLSIVRPSKSLARSIPWAWVAVLSAYGGGNCSSGAFPDSIGEPVKMLYLGG